MKPNILVIGRNEMIEIVNHLSTAIPAKIDTGADSCAIWATNIHEENGQLFYNLFGVGSAYYSNQSLSTDHYKVTSVKNSFGERELRYTVWLPIRLGGKRYKVRFNLADRSRNHFPILIGKRFLNKKFLVDVSRSYLVSNKHEQPANKKILVLTSRLDKITQTFFSKVRQEVVGDVELCHYDDLIFRMGADTSVTVASTQVDVASYSLVYFKAYSNFQEKAIAVATYLSYKNVIYRDEELDLAISRSKLSEYMKLCTHDLPVPKTVVASTAYLKQQSQKLVEELGLPLVMKDVFSDRGRNNYLVQDIVQLNDLLNSASNESLFALQKYVPSNGFTRVLMFGREVGLVIERSATTHNDPAKAHLNKPKGGSNASLVSPQDINSQVASLAQKGAEVMRRQVAGVDLLQDKATGEWYILEVNYNPQMVSGTFSNNKASALAKYLNYELERW